MAVNALQFIHKYRRGVNQKKCGCTEDADNKLFTVNRKKNETFT